MRGALRCVALARRTFPAVCPMIPYRFGPCMFGPARRATSEVGSEAWRSGHQGPKLARRSTRAHPNSPNPDRAARRTALLDCMTSGTLRLEQLRAFRRVAIVHGEIAVEDGRSRRLRVDNGEVAELDNRLRWLLCRRHALRRNQNSNSSTRGRDRRVEDSATRRNSGRVALSSSSLMSSGIEGKPGIWGTETSAEVLVGPPGG